METETRKARYHSYGEVEVLQSEGTLTQIRTNGNEFWVKTDKLVFPKAKKGHVLVDSLVSAPIAALAPTNPMPPVENDYQHACPDHGAEIAAAVAAPDFKPYKGLAESFPRDLFAWANAHCLNIRASVPVQFFERFAHNLKEANGQEFTPLLPGVTERGPKVKGLALEIRFDEKVPANFFSEIQALQKRYGIRRDTERSTARTRVIYCNALGWELLRAGRTIGGSKVGA